MLVRLCSHACPAEELARKDDLSLLFSAITSSCPAQNVMWRKSAAEVLMTISRHGLTKPVVNYIHSKCPLFIFIFCVLFSSKHVFCGTGCVFVMRVTSLFKSFCCFQIKDV